MKSDRTIKLFESAKNVLPGGVNSSTRLNQAIGTPFFASRGKKGKVWDVDGNEFIDMCCSFGAGLLGHGHPAIDKAVNKASEMGYLCSFETEYHEELARKVCDIIPSAQRVRFCSSGSEATMHLIRACRAYTGRNKIIRLEGNFHGYHELIYIGGQPPASAVKENRIHPYIESPGIPEEFANFIIPVPNNDPDAFRQAVNDHADQIAMVIMEPVGLNCACIHPQPDYLRLVRELTKEAGIILFFDEILASFKKSLGGAQESLQVTPDVCTIGKSLGGGLPLSAFCGKAEIMDMYQPTGPVQHSGTFNAHLVSVLAGLAFLNEAQKPEFYAHLQKLEKQFHAGMNNIIKDNNLNMIVPNHGARFNFVLGRRQPALRYEDTFCHNKEILLKIFKACWQRGVYFHDYGGGPAHHGYSVTHNEQDIDKVLNVLEEVLKELKDELQ
jgi:glutamate-1-semialdehyde 2,1-aminomutase